MSIFFKAIVLIALTVLFLGVATATAQEIKYATAEGVVESNPAQAGIEVSETSIKNIYTGMILVQIGAGSTLLAPGQATPNGNSNGTIYVAHPGEENIFPATIYHPKNDIWLDGGNFYISLVYKRPAYIPLY